MGRLTCMLTGLLVSCSTATANNFDFSQGNLSEWTGSGFYVTTANDHGPSLQRGVCSSDANRSGVLGSLRYRFRVSPQVGTVRFSAYYHLSGDLQDRQALLIRLRHGKRIIPLQMQTADGWQMIPNILPRQNGKPGVYRWDVSNFVNQILEVELIDGDARPGCHLFCSGFVVHGMSSNDHESFARDIALLERTNRHGSFQRYESQYFLGWSNADSQFTAERMRDCDRLYRSFYEHFRRRGFSLRSPQQKLMVAILDSQTAFEGFLDRRMPSMITGIYNRRSNRLAIYDVNHNRQLLARKSSALAAGKAISLDQTRMQYEQTIRRRANEIGEDATVSTAFHEGAHHICFNTELLNRHGDVPLWLAEGLACYCESTRLGEWQGIGQPNPERLQVLVKIHERKEGIHSLKSLLISDDWCETSQSGLAGYAQSWALVHGLMKHHPQKFRQYLQRISTRTTDDYRLQDFCAVFGTDLSRIESWHRNHIRQLVALYGKDLD